MTYIAEFGRWDDILCLLGTPAQREMVVVIRNQLAEDEAALKRREAGEEDAHISLLAKWLPSDNASSPRTRKTAARLIHALGMEKKEYRRLITSLRARIGLAECQMTRKRPEKINYEALPAQAMLKYRKAFERNDGLRFLDYLADVETGKKQIHTETLFPYEVLRPFFAGYNWYSGDVEGIDLLEQIWNHLPGTVGNVNAISVVDTSGSMYWSAGYTLMASVPLCTPSSAW